MKFDAVIIIRFSVSEKKKLKALAKLKGLSISALARMWLMEKANETLKLSTN